MAFFTALSICHVSACVSHLASVGSVIDLATSKTGHLCVRLLVAVRLKHRVPAEVHNNNNILAGETCAYVCS